jgi:DNA-binding Lrp family transcriptional regulator
MITNEMDRPIPNELDTVPARMSAAETARRLGTSVPRIKRAIERVGLGVETRPGGRVTIDRRQFKRLRRELGVRAKIDNLSVTDVAVLSTLARSPLGLVSGRAVAQRAGIAPTSASKALKRLERKGLAQRERTWLAAGRAREQEIVRANYSSPQWPALAPKLSKFEPPALVWDTPSRHRTVPPRLKHLFWNTAESQLDLERAGGYVARRLIQTGDLEGLAWGAANLEPDDWRHAAETRGIQESQRALAINLAAAR